MPFDSAQSAEIAFARTADLDDGFAGGEMDVAWALQNPEQALAVLMLAPRPCAALDALLAA